MKNKSKASEGIVSCASSGESMTLAKTQTGADSLSAGSRRHLKHETIELQTLCQRDECLVGQHTCE